MPGLTAKDIQIAREFNDLVISIKDREGSLTLLKYFDISNLNRPLHLQFADGPRIDLNREISHQTQTFFPVKIIQNL